MKSFIPSEIIRKKRSGNALTHEELKSFFASYLKGDVKDYQVSALLMAIYFNSLDLTEASALTSIMTNSGERLVFPEEIQPFCVDKHSTGGVGDKASFIILPLLILESCYVPMMAGRGLGHTGGTIDKMEAIPGIQTRYSLEEAKKLLLKNKGFLIGQSTEIAPLDYQLYHLRDVTATVESPGLIISSILSKKIAEGIKHLVMDIKTGSGAFLSKEEDAKTFAKNIITVAKENGVQTSCLITNMDQPLGRSAGNTLELKEVFDILSGSGPEDTLSLSIELSAQLVKMCYPQRGLAEIMKSMQANVDDGKAFETLIKIFVEQGGDSTFLNNYKNMPTAKHKHPVLHTGEAGYVHSIDVRQLGMSIVTLGGGRKAKEDSIDYTVGLSEMKRCNEFVENNEPLLVIEGNDLDKIKAAAAIIKDSYVIKPEKATHIRPLIIHQEGVS